MKIDIAAIGAVEWLLLAIIVSLLFVTAWANWQLAMMCAIVVLVLLAYIGRRAMRRRDSLLRYMKTMVANVEQTSTYALQNLPMAIAIIDNKSHICWSNSVFRDWLGGETEKTQRLSGVMPALRMDKLWGKSGYLNEHIDKKDYRIVYRYIAGSELPVCDGEEKRVDTGYMALYFEDITEIENIRKEAEASLPVLAYIEIDNLEDITKGLSDIEKTNIWAEVNNSIVEELNKVDGFVRAYTDDSYIALFSRAALEKMAEHHFPILDRVRSIHTPRRIPVTISMGVATKDTTTKEQAERAKSGLDLALGRGGDQASVYNGSEVKFYGGKSQSTEKNTRVRARVMAQAIRELINDAENIIIMGHEREDYDSFGGAIGVAVMANADKKRVHIAVSDQSEAIRKMESILPEQDGLAELFITPAEAEALTTEHTLIFVVDVHRPDMVAAPLALGNTNRRVVIDHHRRSSAFVEKPLLTYLEPGSSSTSELVTELIQYYAEKIELTEIEASALYAGIVLDTKNFSVQTSSRTFDAASYLRRSGANIAMVRRIFMETFDTLQIKAGIISSADRHGELIFAQCPENTKNPMVIAAQTSDSLITVEGVEASFVFYYMSDTAIGVSARSQGTLNVQLIMEAVGGGGHRTVAGAQLRNMTIDNAKKAVLAAAKNYLAQMRESEEVKK